MVSRVQDIVKSLDAIAPGRLAEIWDNCGLQCGNLSWSVKKIWVSLDPSYEVVKAACDDNADLLVTHHPLFFKPVKSIDTATIPGKIVELSMQNKLSIYSIHTNLDSAEDGLNDLFAELVGLRDLIPFIPSSEGDIVHTGEGLGRVGYLPKPLTLPVLAKNLKGKLGSESIRISGDLHKKVEKVVVCTGSGSSFINEFIASGADVYITGDLRYHDVRMVEDAGLGVIDAGHFASEFIVVNFLSEKIKTHLSELGLHVEIIASDLEKDPFKYI